MNATAFKTPKQGHAISGAFVFLLLGIFAVFLSLMVVFAAQMYKDVLNESDLNTAMRASVNYISNNIRSSDREGAVSVAKLADSDAIVITFHADDEAYHSVIYLYDGAIREMYTDEGLEFPLEYGEIITEAQKFEAAFENGLLRFSVTAPGGKEYASHVAVRCRMEEGAQ